MVEMDISERLENLSPIGYDRDGNLLVNGEDYHWLLERAEKSKRYEDALKRMSRDIPGMVQSKTFDYEKGYYRLLKMVQDALEY